MVRRVLRELRQIEPAYLTCRHAGNMVYTGAACAGGVEEEVDITFPGKVVKVKRQKNYLELEHPLSSFGPILGLTGEGPVMAGCFNQAARRASCRPGAQGFYTGEHGGSR